MQPQESNYTHKYFGFNTQKCSSTHNYIVNVFLRNIKSAKQTIASDQRQWYTQKPFIM